MAKVHLIGNAHIDPVWLWRWPEGYSEVLATFRSVLDRMTENPDYIFTCACARYYQWAEECDPDMFAEIGERIRQGRWVLVGGWVIQPDCNAPGGESFARHALYSQRYFQSRFGKIARTGYNVDSFGHNAMLPQLLRLSGMDRYVYMRPNDTTEKEYPFPSHAFLWESPDGSRVMTYRIPDAYGAAGFEQAAEKAQAHAAMADGEGHPVMCFYGVGNHGGGPTRRNLEALDALIADRGDEYAYSSPDTYFDALENTALPVLTGDLQHHASGCYTAFMAVKVAARLAENRLIAAEKYAALRAMTLGGLPENLHPAWEKLLFNQFHDILGGCCIRAAYPDALQQLGGAADDAAQCTNRALQALAWRIDTSIPGFSPHGKYNDFRLWEQEDHGTPLVVFNPHSYPLTAPIDACVDTAYVADETGGHVPSQRIRSGVTNGDWDKWSTLFTAELPAFGWRTYWLYKKARPCPAQAQELRADPTLLENRFLRVSFDAATGQLCGVFDKVRGRQLLAAPAKALVMDESDSDTWAHGIFEFRRQVGAFSGARMRLCEAGDVRCTLEVTTSYGNSSVRQRFHLYRDLPGLYMDCFVNWQEQHKMLKFSFPTTLRGAHDVASIPYGFLAREADGKEQPMQNWVALCDGEAAMGIATDSRCAYDALDGELRITALRSPIFADHFGARDEDCEFTDQGEHAFTLALLGDEPALTALRQAADALACPPEHILSSYHAGELPQIFRGIEVSAPNVTVTALKGAEDGDGLVLRCRETQGQPADVTITLPGLNAAHTFSLGAQQLCSFRIRGGVFTPCDLLERDMP
ncbi:MAG: glycoside hydrolase family 38 C-terminal domain-containing protein [Eubacteriales bacterium]|nr:glycoside hydrolase family 38 C-terminal domain-containing protein [Eubacteriales bacterium]